MTFLSRTLSSNRLPSLMLLLSFLCTGIVSEPRYITDSYEYSIVASCWADQNFIGMDCEKVNYFFRQPFPSLLVLISSPFVDNYAGIAFWAWVSSSLLLFLIWYSGARLFSRELGFWCWLGFGLSPFIRALSTFADSRIILLPLLFWSAFTLLDKENSARFVFSGALTSVLAFATRMEGLAILPIFLFFQIIFKKGSWKASAILFFFTVVFWITGIWQQGGILSISPRYWEGYLLANSQEMPLRWALDIFGMGVWSPPLRQIAISQPPISMPLDDLNLQEWLSWLRISILDYFPLWSWGLLGFGWYKTIKEPRLRPIFFLLSALTLPSFLITLLPQARDHLFPQANTFPVWMLSLFLIVISLDQLRLLLPTSFGRSVMMVGIALISWFSTPVHLDAGMEFQPIAQQVRVWLSTETPENSIILSSYELAPIVFLSRKRWEQWPSPYEWEYRLQTDAPIYALVSRIDPHANYPLAFTTWKEPTAYFQAPENEFLIIRLK